jgi:hypothetical protein
VVHGNACMYPSSSMLRASKSGMVNSAVTRNMVNKYLGLFIWDTKSWRAKLTILNLLKNLNTRDAIPGLHLRLLRDTVTHFKTRHEVLFYPVLRDFVKSIAFRRV